jgi:hypothetical protein
MLWLGQAVIDVLEGAGIFEGVGAEEFLACDHLADLGGAPGFALGVGEMDTVVGQHGMDLVGHSLDQGAQEVGRGARCCLGVQLGEGELAGAVDGDEEVEFAFSGLNFCDVDMEEADGIGFEFLLRRLVALRIRKPADTSAASTCFARGTFAAPPCRCRQRCNEERVRCGMVGCKAYRQSSSGSSVCRRKATMIASSWVERTVERGSRGPVGRSVTELRFFHFATVFWLIPYRFARPLRLS